MDKISRTNYPNMANSALAARAGDMAPLIEDVIAENESIGMLAEDLVIALCASGYFGMWVPRALGGFEASPLESLDIIDELSYADGSVGWVVMAIGVATASAAAYLPESATRGIFLPTNTPILAGQGVPIGKAIPDGEGYIVSGNWSYGSGIRHANWAHSGAIVYEGDKPRLNRRGEPEVRMFYVPVEKVKLAGNWDVIGLRSTGSIDYSMEPTFIDAEYSHIGEAPTPLRGGPFYTLGPVNIAAIGHSAFALGVGRRVLDELAEFAQSSISRPGGGVAGSESFQEDYARYDSRYRAARAFVYEAWNDLWDSVSQGDVPSRRQLTLIRSALNNATFSVLDVCTFAYKAAGGTALRAGRIQRCFRDILAGAQHISSSNAVLRECGRELAGLANSQVWGMFRLVEPTI